VCGKSQQDSNSDRAADPLNDTLCFAARPCSVTCPARAVTAPKARTRLEISSSNRRERARGLRFIARVSSAMRRFSVAVALSRQVHKPVYSAVPEICQSEAPPFSEGEEPMQGGSERTLAFVKPLTDRGSTRLVGRGASHSRHPRRDPVPGREAQACKDRSPSFGPGCTAPSRRG
jgi:hypothetical protein